MGTKKNTDTKNAEVYEVVHPDANGRSTIVIQNGAKKGKWVKFFLLISILANISMYGMYRQYFSDPDGPQERFHSGQWDADDKVARISVNGVIIGLNTKRIISAIEKADEDDSVKAIVLSVDSPGGGAPDSHQIYHELKKLSAKKPMVISMKRYAASGGYYVAMGAGTEAKIFAEPTTWTGSIGVIIPRFEMAGLGEKLGVKSEPLKTGPFKDSPNPFRVLSEEEKELWKAILDDSLGLFTGVIEENRENLNKEQVAAIATGQVYTANQALENGLIDEIGYESDALKALGEQAGFDPEKIRVVEYFFQPALMDVLMGAATSQQPENQWKQFVESTVPQAMYLSSWVPTAAAW